MKKVLIIGLGLIGGSFAKSLKKNKIAEEIYAFDNDEEAINLAKKAGIIKDFSEISLEFDLIVIATPLLAYKPILKEISAINFKNIIIDLGSVKNFIFDILPKNLEENFIACHPIAGLEKAGFINSIDDLFDNKKFIICQSKKNQDLLVKKVAKIMENINAKVDFIDAKKHDEIYGLMSHLVQFLAFLTQNNADFSDNEFFKTAFRLDKSSGYLWRDIFRLNQKNLQFFYEKFFDNLEANMMGIANEAKIPSLIAKWQKIDLVNLNDKNFDISQIKSYFANQNNNSDLEAIIFRLIIVLSYLQIDEIKDFKIYGGSGFKDFCSIALLTKLDKEFLANIILSHKEKIVEFIKKMEQA